MSEITLGASVYIISLSSCSPNKSLRVNTHSLDFEAESSMTADVSTEVLGVHFFPPLVWTFSVFSSHQDCTCLQIFALSTKI